ncbi:hypothetical protein [Nonomuraea sp. NPDC049709]|uniref:hypothetical protein n=1 Tax=Nonomuraea sp. NPDC049709 TaxID=3154736 RepID=UPI0034466987
MVLDTFLPEPTPRRRPYRSESGHDRKTVTHPPAGDITLDCDRVTAAGSAMPWQGGGAGNAAGSLPVRSDPHGDAKAHAVARHSRPMGFSDISPPTSRAGFIKVVYENRGSLALDVMMSGRSPWVS